MTALVYAVERKGILLNTVRYLVEHGADIHVKLNNGWTLIKIAKYKGKDDIANYLLSQEK